MPVSVPSTIKTLAMLTAFGLAAASASALTIDWSSTAGTNVWATGTNWVGGTAPANNATQDIANFNSATYAFQPTVNAARSVGGITLGSSTVDVTINVTGGAFTVGTTGNVSTGISLDAGKTLTFTGNQVINLNGNIVETGGAANLTLSSTGTMTLAGTNSYSGTTTLTAGTLSLNNDSALGTSAFTINGGTLQSNANGRTIANNMTWGGNFTVAGTTDLILNGTIGTLGAARTITNNNTSTNGVTISGDINNGGNLLTLATGSTATYASILTLSGNISGLGGLTKSGTSVAVLSGTNTYNGTTTVTGSVLRLNNASALSSNSNLTLNGGVIELTSASGNFLLPLGTGAAQVQLTGSGGFSAFGGNRNVNLGGASAKVSFNSGGFLPYNGTLILSSAASDSTVFFQNQIGLNSGPRWINADNGSAAVDAVISNVISGNLTNDALYVNQNPTLATQAGLGTLRLDATNTYVGGTLVLGGKLLVGATGTVPGPVFIAPQSTQQNKMASSAFGLDLGGSINGNVYVQPRGFLLGANVPLSQIMLLAGGALQYNSSGEIPGSGRVLDAPQAGSILVAGYPMDSGFLSRIKTGFNGTIALAVNSSNDLDLSSFPNARLGSAGANAVYSGTLTPSGNTYKLGGGSNTTLTISTALNNGTGSRNLEVAGDSILYYGIRTAGLSIPGVGVQLSGVALTAANGLSGSVSVGRYSALTLSGSSPNGSLASATSFALNGGTLNLTDTASAANSNRLPDVSLDVNRSAYLNYTGLRGTTEDAGTLNLNSGMLYLKTTGTGSSGTATLRFGQVTSTNGLNRSTGSMAIFSSGGNDAITFNNYNAPGPASTMGGWAIAGYTNWATYTGGKVGTLGSYAAWPGSAATDNVDINAASPSALAADKTINSLRYSYNTAASTLDLNGFTLTVTNGGILTTGGTSGKDLTIGTAANNGKLTAGTGAGGNYELFLTYNARNNTINSTIIDNGTSPSNPVAVVVPGMTQYDNFGGWTFNGTNTYSGGTYLIGGKIVAGNDSALGTNALYMNGYVLPVNGSFSNNDTALPILSATGTRTLSNAIIVNTDGIIDGGASTTTFNVNGVITLANNSTLILRQTGTLLSLGGQITGAGNLETASNATLTGSTGNDYTGLTVVLGGNLTLNKSSGNAIPGDVYVGGAANANTSGVDFGTKRVILAANNQIADTGVVTLIGGAASNNYGLLQMNSYNDTIGGLVGLPNAGIVENNHATVASTLTINVGSGLSYSYGGLIRNRATAGGGALNLVKSGTGTQTLTGTNTYTGTTIISSGLLVASSNSALGTGGVTVNSGGQLATAPNVTLTNPITINSGGYFGPQYLVNASGNYSGVPAVTSAVSGLGSTLTLLGGTASANTTLSALWRVRAANETYPNQTNPPVPATSMGLISDVVDFTGTGGDVYALQISYDPNQIVPGMGEDDLVKNGLLYLSFLSGGTYTQAGDTGLFPAGPARIGAYTGNLTLGNWGVDTFNHVAWAVVDHNSQWAVVPEPGTMALLAFGSLAVLNVRRKKKTA